jgi:hypothetical protein
MMAAKNRLGRGAALLRSVGLSGVGLVLGLAAGCRDSTTTVLPATAETQETAIGEKGEIVLQLIGRAPSGTVYRLQHASVLVQGAGVSLVLESDPTSEATRLGAQVPVGMYTALLQGGWWLERVTASGEKGIVLPAELVSANPATFTVTAGGVAAVPLRFQVSGETAESGRFEIVLEVLEPSSPPPPPPEGAVCRSNADCEGGQMCCRTGLSGTCRAATTACPLPDLTVSVDKARSSLASVFETFGANHCALQEQCVDGTGVRRLLRFDTVTSNIGEADVTLGAPTAADGFEFAQCHNHFHFEGYARYELLDATGRQVSAGHKQAFCLRDDTAVGLPGAPTTERYNCDFQGIQRGWSDTYGANLDCQWVDITAVAPGDYVLRISINPDRILPESNYNNNVAEVPVTVRDVQTLNPLEACTERRSSRDCGWELRPNNIGRRCQPGSSVSVACGCLFGGVCDEDAMLRVCPGTTPCLSFQALATGDDECDLCPGAVFTCPPSGEYSVLTGPYRGGEDFTCDISALQAAPPATGVADAGAP